MRDYQEKIVSDIVQNFNIDKPYVLGSSPSSGKTEISIEVIIRLLSLKLVKNALVLAHSTNVLKDNFYSRLLEYFHDSGDITVMDKGKDFDKNALIQVMIPQNIKHIEGQFDLIIVDEAHHNVLVEDGNYSKIVERVQPKFQLLLTGTPSKFIRENDRSNGENPYHINCVGMDMVGFEHFHDVKFDLIRSAYGFTNNDYDSTNNVSSNTQFSFEETERTINNVIIAAVRNVALRNGIILPTNYDFVKEGIKLIQEKIFGKTLIMCRNIEQANQVKNIVEKIFKVKVGVSESKGDTDSIQLKRFKEGSFDFLCVVNRAREGYDDKKIVNLIDITMTHNIDLIYQMFCRVVRKDVSYEKPKLYLKVTSNAEGMSEYTLNIMTASLMLASTENLRRFNGSNFRNIIMPKVEKEPDNEGDGISVGGKIGVIDPKGGGVTRRKLSDLMALDLVKMFVDDHEFLISGNERYSMTTLGDALDILDGRNYVRDKQVYFDLFRREGIINSGIWEKKYKELSERDGFKYHSNPWTIFNQTVKEFFDECFVDRNSISDKQVYFDLFKKEGITGCGTWAKKYKELSERDGLIYRSKPWWVFNQKEKEFFDECFGDRTINFVSDKQVYFDLFKKEEITGSGTWRKKYKELSDRDGLIYHSNIWKMFNQTVKEFFDECFGDRTINFVSDKQVYFDLFKKEGVTGCGIWEKKYKELSERDGLIYRSEPWTIFNQTVKEFFDECFVGRNPISDKQVYFDLFKKEEITGSGTWAKKYKELSDRDGLIYHSVPWWVFNQKAKEFFDECFGDRTINFVSDKQVYFDLFKKEGITGCGIWEKKYKELSERDGLIYRSAPWLVFNQKAKEFFDECFGDRNPISDKQVYFDLFKKEEITGSGTWAKKYKEISDRDGLIYHSTPWTIFNQTIKEFFDEYRTWLNTIDEKSFKKAYLGKFSEMNKEWNTKNSVSIHENLKKNPKSWYEYHKLYSEARKKWDEIPYKEIAKKINSRPEWVIGDFGCGENLLKKEITNKVHSFDHVAIDESVVSSDLACIPLNNEVLDVVVFSLALMHTNYNEYLKEAYRVLKPMGLVFIAEPRQRWSDENGNLDKERINKLANDNNFKLAGDVKKTDKFIYIDMIKIN